MKIKPTINIDDAIKALEEKLKELELEKEEQKKAIKDEIDRQEKLKSELEAKDKFKDWHPSVGNIIDVIEMSEETENLKYFKNLRYTSCIHDIDDGTNLEFGDGWVIKRHASRGGGEGDGSERYVVLSVTQHDADETFWMVPGYYESYNGSEFELHSMYKVEPYQKMVTDYRQVR